MRKSQVVDLASRRLGLRATRLTSLVQRLSDAGLLPVSAGPPYQNLTPTEIARVLLIGITDEGLGGAARTVQRYGDLQGRGSNLEEALGHALSRPESLAPSRSGFEIHTGDRPYAVLTTVSADGARSMVFGDMPEVESVERTVVVSGAALFAIARELSGISGADVDRLLDGAAQVRGAGNGLG